MRTGLTRVIAGALTFVPTTAFAHAGHGHAHGFIHGFAHPLSGLDHVLVMIAIGIVAGQFVRRALWLLPATFAMALTLGGILAITHTSTPSDVAYAAGFMAATTFLHAVGIALGLALRVERRRPPAHRATPPSNPRFMRTADKPLAMVAKRQS